MQSISYLGVMAEKCIRPRTSLRAERGPAGAVADLTFSRDWRL